MKTPSVRTPTIYRFFWCIPALLLATGLMAADKKEAGSKLYVCRKAAQPIVIDGKLDDPAWKTADPIKRFFHYPDRDAPVPLKEDKIQAFFLYDQDYLYVGAKIRDRDIVANPAGKTQKKETIHLDGDVFEVFVMPEGSKTTYYEIHVNPLNVVWDARMVAKDYMTFNDVSEWNSGVKSAVTVDGTINQMDEDQGWTVEEAIPLSCFTGRDGKVIPPRPGGIWRVNVAMYDYSYQNDDGGNGSALQFISSSKLARLNFHLRGDYDRIRFEGDAPAAKKAK